MSRSKINLGLKGLKVDELVDIFTKIENRERAEEVKEILVDAVNILCLNFDNFKANKKSIKETVNVFANQFTEYHNYYGMLLSGEYSGFISDDLKLENLYIYLAIIASLNSSDSEEYSLMKAEACYKSKFIELFYAIDYLTQINFGFQEIASIIDRYLEENMYVSSMDKYLNETTKNFNIDGLYYIMKSEIKGILIDRITNEAKETKEEYVDGSMIKKVSIFKSIEMISEAYGSVIAKTIIYKTLDKKQRVSDRKDVVVCGNDLAKEYFVRLTDEEIQMKNLKDIFSFEDEDDRW